MSRYCDRCSVMILIRGGVGGAATAVKSLSVGMHAWRRSRKRDSAVFSYCRHSQTSFKLLRCKTHALVETTPHQSLLSRFPRRQPAPPFSLITGSGSGTRVPRDRSWGANPGQNGRPCSRVAREEGQEGLEVEERECSAEEKIHCGSKRMAPTPPFVLFNHSSIENRSHPLRARGRNTHARW